jgi:small basic protein
LISGFFFVSGMAADLPRLADLLGVRIDLDAIAAAFVRAGLPVFAFLTCRLAPAADFLV